MRLLRYCNAQDAHFRLLLFVVSLLPTLSLIWDAFFDQLGFNPFEALIARSGFWSMFFLLVTLAITPVRRWLRSLCAFFGWRYGKRLADWNFLIKSRRMMGLFSFFYLCLHFGIYLGLELAWNPVWLLQDLQQRPFLNLGLLAWIISLILALTSPLPVRRWMGRYWRKVHRLMYPLALLALAHVGLEAKQGEDLFIAYAIIVTILLLHRILSRWTKRWYRVDDNGLEAKR